MISPRRFKSRKDMGRYFKVIDKGRMDGHIDYVDNLLQKPDSIYDVIEEIVGDMECPANGIPYKIEVDGWCDLACVDEIYETREFVVECLSEEDYREYQE